jgi:hypothetical protein
MASEDNIAFITFFESWEQDGTGPDGLPLFRTVLKVRKVVPPYTEVSPVATQQDIDDFPAQYNAFQKERAGRTPDVEGYPLALWPVIGAADFQNCAARGIVTVEQLARLAGSRADAGGIPAPILELAKRAQKMVELQKEVGRFESVIETLTAARDALVEELKEAHITISAQSSMIDMLRSAPKAA